MRTFVIGSLLLLTSVVSAGHGQAQSTGRNTIYIAPNVARTVFISRSGVILTTLAIPGGTLISVTFDTTETVRPVIDGRFEFHGYVAISAMAASQKPANLKLDDAMLQSPVQLTASGVDVLIAPQ